MLQKYKDLPALILASASPRRKEILNRVGLEFEIDFLTIDEVFNHQESPAEAVSRLALEKGQALLDKHPGKIIISADTIVCVGDIVLGKPADRNAASNMLQQLSGKWHDVYTGCALQIKTGSANSANTFYEKTSVKFHDLSLDDIDAYIDTGEVFDKAGSYGIQDYGALLVAEIRGCYFNVMGFPVARGIRELLAFNEKVS
jgi:septum formation protein